MEIVISKLQAADVDTIDALMKQNSGTIGFLPRIVLEKHIEDESVLGAKTEDGELAGYLLYATYNDRFRIVQLCVAEGFRRQGVAGRLIEALKATATTQKVIRLNCRNDFPAHQMWPTLGFVPVSEKPGRSREGRLLTRWRLVLAADDQLALFRANISEDVLDVVIDAQIFFAFNEPDSESTLPSKSLLSDLFMDSLNIWITDELLVEINRNTNANERDSARTRASQFSYIHHNPIVAASLVSSLKQLLPSNTDSQISDINHLAKAGASDVKIFVTRDQRLQRRAAEIAEVMGLQVLSPADLILRLRELSETQAATPDYVAGLRFAWRGLTASELSGFPFTQFLHPHERVNQLRSKVEAALADPVAEVEILWSEEEPVALRILNRTSPQTLTVSLGRVTSSEEGSLLGRFIASDVIYKAMREGLVMIRIEPSALSRELTQDLYEMGFTECGGAHVRFCFASYLDKDAALAEITVLSPESLAVYESMNAIEFEGYCSPMGSEASQNYYMIPIRSGYALNLFDRERSSHDLFGGNQDVLLRWSNVYYRSSNSQNLVQAPGRILWYVSGHSGGIVAISRLDEVIVDTPKELFKRFRRYGTLEWSDLYRMCKQDVSKKLMALRFSHTFPFQRRISISEIRARFAEDNLTPVFQ